MSPPQWNMPDGAWRSVVESIPDAVAISDDAGILRFANPAFLALVGFASHELLGTQAPFPYWPEDKLDMIREAYGAVRGGQLVTYETELLHRQGQRIPVRVNAAPLVARGRQAGQVVVFVDMTAQKRAERSLRQSEQRWQSVAENPYDFVALIDRTLLFTYVNHTEDGIRKEELIGKATPFDFVDPRYHDVMRSVFTAAFEQGQPGGYEVFVPQLRKWFSCVVGPIFEDGRVVSASLLTRDVTSHKTTEENLREAKRLETLGRLVGGIAHDFNNLLLPIAGNAHLALADLPAASPVREGLGDIIRAAERARDLIARILVFSRPPSQQREQVRVQDVALEVVRLVCNRGNPRVTIQLDTDAHCLPVEGAPGEVHQILMNLCTNAVQALAEEGGRIHVAVRAKVVTEDMAAQSNMAAGPAVCICVADDGPGMSEETQAKIFDPFYTTRPVGQGTGLGLSIVHAVTTRLGGTVLVHSQLAAGARFEVFLPAVAPQAPSAVEAVAAPHNVTPRRVVVVVDDDELVVRFLRRTLTDAGHAVVAFTRAAAALEYLLALPEPVDCVLTDETMPLMTGTQLAGRLVETAPALPVVLMSGYTQRTDDTRPANVRLFLQKPMAPQDVLRAVAQVTNNASPH